MTAPVTVKGVNELRQLFAELCENRSMLCAEGILTLHEAVDELQAFATVSGLIEAIGQQAVQETMAFADDGGMADAYEYEIKLRAADLVRQWELNAPRVRHLRDLAHLDSPLPARKPYATPQSTIDAFYVVMQSDDPERIAAWLRNNPDDAPALLETLEAA